jgi:hypothetical protein
VTDTFLSYGLHMTRSESDCMFCVSRVLCVLLETGGEQKLVCGAGQMLASLLDGLSCVL